MKKNIPQFDEALSLVEERLGKLRKQVPNRRFDPKIPAEVEINQFWFGGNTIDRIMVVLRSTGCSYYKTKQGCSMCAHYDGTTESPVTAQEYVAQWESVINGTALKWDKSEPFDLNHFPVVCLYNLGSFLNPEEVPVESMQSIFASLAEFRGVEKVIIESRAEYITREVLEKVRAVNKGIIEVGIGLESVDHVVRELCHHKNIPDLNVFHNAVDLLHEYDFKVLAYVNQKPPFLTESEAIEDTIATSVFAYNSGVDAVSIEPTSLQAHSLTDNLYQIGAYRVPWLWSVIKAVHGIYDQLPSSGDLDLRLGGYFDEEILSGSQGVAPGVERNELFPHTTSGNCDYCTERVIETIKEFNRTNDPNILYGVEPCEYCQPIWQDALKVNDTRLIPKRIIDTLGGK